MVQGGLALQVPGRDAEGRSPHPVANVSDRRPAAERLGKGLGDCVGGHVLITAEGIQRPPQAIAVLSIDGFDLVSCRDTSHRGCHYARTGTDWVQYVTAAVTRRVFLGRSSRDRPIVQFG